MKNIVLADPFLVSPTPLSMILHSAPLHDSYASGFLNALNDISKLEGNSKRSIMS